SSLPAALRWLLWLGLLGLLVGSVAWHYPKGPRSLHDWRQVGRLLMRQRAVHLWWLLITPLWPAPTTTVEPLVAALAEGRGLVGDAKALRWIDAPLHGLKTAFTSARAVVLLKRPGAPHDVYAVRVAFAYDGTPTRVTGLFNISRTAVVDDRTLSTWQKWAAWELFNGTGAASVELADFRAEATTAGPGWSLLRRLQR